MNLKELIQTRTDFNFILVNVIIISYLSMEFHEKGQQKFAALYILPNCEKTNQLTVKQ